MSQRLALGTAQFGLAYGVANQTGRVSPREVSRILARAEARGMDTLDTAIAYGESEQALGQAGVQGWRIVSKLPAVPDSVTDVAGWVREQVQGSLKRLEVSRLYALLLHRPGQLLGPHGAALMRALESIRDDGLALKIGVSIYDPHELDALLAGRRLDLVQAPLSILDRRMVDSGWARRLQSLGVEWHVRSIFLQGLLLMTQADRPEKFGRWMPVWQQWDDWLQEARLSPLQACLRYALSVPEVDRVVIGVDHLAQLDQILAAAGGEMPEPPHWVSSVDAGLLNPGRWSEL